MPALFKTAARIACALALVAAGAAFMMSRPSGALLPQVHTYTSLQFSASGNIDVFVQNTGPSTIEAEITLFKLNGTVQQSALPLQVPPLSRTSTTVQSEPGGNTYFVTVISSKSTFFPTIFFTDGAAQVQRIGPTEFLQTNGFAGVVETLTHATDGLDGLVATVGNRTKTFCAEGSVRNDDNGVLQLYVTIFSKDNQEVTITYITNKGPFERKVQLEAQKRFTDDANAFLIGPGGPLAGQRDVDVSVRVSGSKPLFLACPVYFNRTIGRAGLVNGGTVQDGSSN